MSPPPMLLTTNLLSALLHVLLWALDLYLLVVLASLVLRGLGGDWGRRVSATWQPWTGLVWAGFARLLPARREASWIIWLAAITGLLIGRCALVGAICGLR